MSRKPKKKPLTVGEYLCHMGQAVLCCNVEAIRTEIALLTSNELDVKVPIGEHETFMDGASIIPEGWHGLDEMEIECESAVKVEHDENGNPTGLSMTMTKGLFTRGMHVKFKAKFSRKGTVEAVEILREAANHALRNALNSEGIKIGIKPKPTEESA